MTNNVSQLLPHSGNMVLIDTIVSVEEASIVCESKIEENHLLLSEEKVVPATCAIEFMAQSAALLAGTRFKNESTTDGDDDRPPRPKLGFLLGTRKLELRVDAFHVGQELVIHACEADKQDPLYYFSCSVVDKLSKSILAESTISVFLKHE